MSQTIQTKIAENIEEARTSSENTRNTIRESSSEMVEADEALAYLEAADSLLRSAVVKLAGVREQFAMHRGEGKDNFLRTTIRDYYALIDQQRIDEVLSLFSETARYVRCEAVYEGIAELDNFYRNERKITGNHQISSIWVVGKIGIVEGVFVGKGADGQPKSVGFADFFTFNNNGKIKDRHTYLMLGSNYVKE